MFVVASLLDGRKRVVGIHMAAACTVPQLADGVKNSWRIDLLVWPLFVITRVTAGAIRFIGRVSPRNCLAVSGVAVQADDGASMVARIVSGCVPEVDGRPSNRVVAAIALQRRDEMVARFSGRLVAVVTGGTASSDAGVIEVRRHPGNRRVADVALSRGGDVGRVLAGRLGAVVAGGAGTGDTAVIEAHGCPRGRHVTVVADIAGGQMGRWLAHCDGTVVAALAGADDGKVVDPDDRLPDGVGMAVLAGVGGLHVGRVLAGGGGAVMAAEAVAADAAVVEVRRHPGVGRMAVVAGVAGG